jgi:hypothetical protein
MGNKENQLTHPVDRDRHWIYFTIGEDTDNGSIIDFVQKRKGGNLGDVRRALRPWLFELAPSIPIRATVCKFPMTP